MEKKTITFHDKTIVLLSNQREVYGDGSSDSTMGCLELLYRQGEGRDVLDIGTGTGIQSIFAKKFGAKKVVAVDSSAVALLYAQRNAEINNEDIEFKLNIYNEYLDFKADVIVANLPSSCVDNVLAIIGKSMKEDAVLIFSWARQIVFTVDLKGFEIVDHIEGEEYDAYAVKEKK